MLQNPLQVVRLHHREGVKQKVTDIVVSGSLIKEKGRCLRILLEKKTYG